MPSKILRNLGLLPSYLLKFYWSPSTFSLFKHGIYCWNQDTNFVQNQHKFRYIEILGFQLYSRHDLVNVKKCLEKLLLLLKRIELEFYAFLGREQDVEFQHLTENSQLSAVKNVTTRTVWCCLAHTSTLVCTQKLKCMAVVH